MYFIKLFTLLLVTSCFIQCSDVQSISKKRSHYYTRYFREKRIAPLNQFKHLEVTFEQEIIGTPVETNQALKAIEKKKEGFYKVLYHFSNQIHTYELIKQGHPIASAIYEYGRENSVNFGKVIKINYFDELRNLIAYDTIIYNKSGRPYKTTRYSMPGKKLNNIF